MLPSLDNIVYRLRTERGDDFRDAVKDAFVYIKFDAKIDTSEAASDIIVEGLYADNPFFIVCECTAVDSNSEVGYQKLGQLRGNFPSYTLDSKRQRIFNTAYKVLIGRPKFSDNTKKNARPDVTLLSSESLISILNEFSTFRFSQTEMETIFKTIGEIGSENIKTLIFPHRRKIDVAALVMISLLEDPFLSKLEKRKRSATIDQVWGESNVYSKLLGLTDLTKEEVVEGIRDLSTPFLTIVDRQGSNVKLVSSPLPDFDSEGKITVLLGTVFFDYLHKLSAYKK